MTLIFRYMTIFCDITKWNKWQTKWDRWNISQQIYIYIYIYIYKSIDVGVNSMNVDATN